MSDPSPCRAQAVLDAPGLWSHYHVMGTGTGARLRGCPCRLVGLVLPADTVAPLQVAELGGRRESPSRAEGLRPWLHWIIVGSPATTVPLTRAAGSAGCDPGAGWQETSFSNGSFICRLKTPASHCPSSASLPFAAWARGGWSDIQRSQQVHRPLHKSASYQPGPGGGGGRANLIGPFPSVITVIYNNNYSPFYFSATYLNVDVHH